MTRFAFRVKRKGLEYKMEDWLCSKYIKEIKRSHVKGIESTEMEEEEEHFKFTPTPFLTLILLTWKIR
jgi:hypothetical protein